MDHYERRFRSIQYGTMTSIFYMDENLGQKFTPKNCINTKPIITIVLDNIDIIISIAQINTMYAS